jgi:primosomal replication protein N
MKITYSIWQGSLIKGTGFIASSMAEVVKTIEELNSVNPKLKFEYFVTEIKQLAK